MGNAGKTVAVGLSGGLDSAIAAWRLLQEGWHVVGLTMSIWDGTTPMADSDRTSCFGPGEVRHLQAAAAMAERLGIEHRVICLADEFRHKVLDDFRAEYLAGRTPNPCVQCNQFIKFGALLDVARAQGVEFDYFATGHYARVARDATSRRWQLLRGRDQSKDQSYFLSRLRQDQLQALLLPLGDLLKADVRIMAQDLGWQELAEREESQDFACGHYAALFQDADTAPGDVVTRDGTKLGHHRGIVHYTVGQRKGLGLGGGGTPWHVLEIDALRNRLVVGAKEDLYRHRLTAAEVNWVGLAEAPIDAFHCGVQIRQQHQAAAATVSLKADQLLVEFDEPQLAVTPGQIAVFYEGERVLASGVIADNRSTT